MRFFSLWRDLEWYCIRGWHVRTILFGMPFLLTAVGLWLVTNLLVAAPLAPTVPTAPGLIAGQVVDGANRPLPAIQVRLYRLNILEDTFYIVRTTQTAELGTYRFPTLSPGIYAIEFADPLFHYAFQFYPAASTLGAAHQLSIAGNELTAVNAILQQPGAITGIVAPTHDLTTYSGTVMPYRKLDDQRWQEMTPVTTEVPTNTFAVRGLPTGTYRLCAMLWTWESGSYSECYDDVAAYGAAGVHNATDIAVTAGMTTTGIHMTVGNFVVDPEVGGLVRNEAGWPLSGINVKITGLADSLAPPIATATSTDFGSYRVRAPVRGLYRVDFVDPTGTYAPATYQQPGAEGATPIQLDLYTLRQGVDVTLTKAAHITGTVLIHGQTPPSDGNVTLLPADEVEYLMTVPIDPLTGHYDLGGLTSGAYRILAGGGLGYEGFIGFYGGETLESAAIIQIETGEVRSGVDVNLAADEFEGVISGTVTADGQVAPQIRVDLFWSQYNPTQPSSIYYTLTDNAGRYRIAGLRAGIQLVRFSDPAGIYATTYYTNAPAADLAQQLLILGATKIPHVDGELARAGSLAGRVTLADGRPIANASVQAYAAAEGSWHPMDNEWVRADSTGHYRLSGLRPGSYLVKFYHPTLPLQEFYGGGGALETAVPVTISAGRTTTVDQILGPDAVLYLPLIAR